jgi:hypothetical protein
MLTVRAGRACGVVQIEGNTDNSLEVLSALDTVKMSMEKCSSILVEAEKLKKLSEDVDNVFRTNDFRRVRSSSLFSDVSSSALRTPNTSSMCVMTSTTRLRITSSG